jgi:hypothetical protein
MKRTIKAENWVNDTVEINVLSENVFMYGNAKVKLEKHELHPDLVRDYGMEQFNILIDGNEIGAAILDEGKWTGISDDLYREGNDKIEVATKIIANVY